MSVVRDSDCSAAWKAVMNSWDSCALAPLSASEYDRLFAGRKLRKNRIGSTTWIEYWPRALRRRTGPGKNLGGTREKSRYGSGPGVPNPDIADLAQVDVVDQLLLARLPAELEPLP